MPAEALHPETQQLIQQVEGFAGRMVLVTDDPDLKVMASLAWQDKYLFVD